MPAAVMPGVVVRQRKPWRRKDGLFIYFEGASGGGAAVEGGAAARPLAQPPSRAPASQPDAPTRRQRGRHREPQGRDEGCAAASHACEPEVVLTAALARVQAPPSPAPWPRRLLTCGRAWRRAPTPSCEALGAAAACVCGDRAGSRPGCRHDGAAAAATHYGAVALGCREADACRAQDAGGCEDESRVVPNNPPSPPRRVARRMCR